MSTELSSFAIDNICWVCAAFNWDIALSDFFCRFFLKTIIIKRITYTHSAATNIKSRAFYFLAWIYFKMPERQNEGNKITIINLLITNLLQTVTTQHLPFVIMHHSQKSYTGHKENPTHYTSICSMWQSKVYFAIVSPTII